MKDYIKKLPTLKADWNAKLTYDFNRVCNVLTQDMKLTRNLLQRVMPSPPIMEELLRSIMMAPDSRAKEEAITAARQLAQSLPNLDDIAATQSILSEVELANLSTLLTDVLQLVPTADQVKQLTKDIINTLRND